MKISRVVALAGLFLAASAQVAMAQPNVVVENAVVPAGTPTVDIDVTFTRAAGNTTAGFFEVSYNSAELSVTDITNCAPPAIWACSTPSAGVVRWVSAPDFSGELANFTGTITFDLSSAVVGFSYPLTVQNEEYLDLMGEVLPPMGTMNGSIEVQDVPAPVFQLTHDGGGAGNTIDFGVDTLPGGINSTVMATVENIGNDDMNNLVGNCDLTDDQGGVFTINPDPAPFDLAPMATEGFDLNCSTDVPGVYVGQMTCMHNGASSPNLFTLQCEEAPSPTYGSTPGDGNPLATMMGNEGNGDVMTMPLAITNEGEMGSTLTGSCSLVNNNTAISLPNGNFSVAFGAMQSIGLVCDDAAEGVFNDTVTCTADPSSTNTGPFTYAIQCDIGPADLGTFGSTPMSGGTIDLTPGGPVPEGTDLTNAGQLLVRNTGQPGDTDVDYSCDITGGSTEITQSPSPSVGTLVAGGGDIVINYSCDTTADGAFSATVQCDWDATGDEGAGAGSEMYTVTCDVRDPETDVTESPPNGTPQIADVMPGDPVTFSFTFTETLDEGEPASLDNCSLSGGAPFAITAPASFPQPIPSGGSVQVDVEFTDPGMGDTFNDLLTCVYTDTDSNPETVNWPLEVNISGRNARFRVTKDFDDDNAAGVEVTMDCNTGLPLQQSGVVYDPDSNPGPGQFTELQFIIVDFEPGTMNCDISEVVPAGYEGSYFADVGDSGTAANVFDDEDGCHYEGVEGSDFICEITNELQIVTVTVFKEWIDEHPEFQLPTFAEITLWCNEPIFFPLVEIEQSTGTEGANGLYSATTYIQPGSPGVFGVYPHWDGSTFCFVTETPEAGVIQDVSDCENIPLAPGQGGECTIVNTRLFAGIPTLSQYGLILLALLMLGVGLVGFRRYT